jgi:hypothetical protein
MQAGKNEGIIRYYQAKGQKRLAKGKYDPGGAFLSGIFFLYLGDAFPFISG